MKVLRLVLICVMIATTIFFLVLAQIRSANATEYAELAMNNLLEANRHHDIAEMAAQRADEEAANTRIAQVEAERIQQELEICRSSK